MSEEIDVNGWIEGTRDTWKVRHRSPLQQFAFALRAFLQGFVGQTALPRESRAACDALTHRANRRGRCC